MKFVTLIAIVFSSFIFCSCGTGLKVKKADFKKIDTSFSGAFIDRSFKARKRTAIPGMSVDVSDVYKKSITTLLMLQDVNKYQDNPITLKLNSNKDLVVTYKDSLQVKRTKLFKGKLQKRGYYEFFHYKKRKGIPPLFPIIYGKTNISRLRFGFSNNNLVIDDYFISNANIFIFAAGSSSRIQYYFKPINK